MPHITYAFFLLIHCSIFLANLCNHHSAHLTASIVHVPIGDCESNLASLLVTYPTIRRKSHDEEALFVSFVMRVRCDAK